MNKKTIPAGQFKTHCLKLMDEVQKHNTSLVITKRGKPVAKLVPIEEEASPSLFGALKGSVTIKGDIIAPIDEEWDVNQ